MIPGLAVLALWAVLLVAGRVGGILLLEQIALVIAVAGLVLLFAGLAVFRASWAAIAYLLLGVPIWDGFTEPLHLRFQLLSAGYRRVDAAGDRHPGLRSRARSSSCRP